MGETKTKSQITKQNKTKLVFKKSTLKKKKRTCGMDLIVHSKQLCGNNPALFHLDNPPSFPHQHHFSVKIVKENNAVTPREATKIIMIMMVIIIMKGCWIVVGGEVRRRERKEKKKERKRPIQKVFCDFIIRHSSN